MILLSEKQTLQIRRLVLLTGIATTLVVWTSLADPINLPKMFVLTIASGWIIGLVVTTFVQTKERSLSLGQWAVIAFVLCTTVAGLVTDVKYSAFFGEIQRNNGAFSYIALAIVALSAMLSFTIANLKQVRNWILSLGSVLTAYGLLQTFGHDPFKWVLLYNHVVGTLGNPDFFSGIVGAAAIASVWLMLREKEIRYRAAGLVLLMLQLFVLKRCGSMQGLVAFALGATLLVISWLWQIKRKFGIAALIVAALGIVPLVLGLLDKGPLARFLYRGSIQNRVDYWHAALSMFKAHPWFGVGLERFGQNYGQYAPQIQVVQGQGTDNAHNVFLQLLATGGLLVILPYLFLIAVIFVSVIRGIKRIKGTERIDIVALFSIWLSLLFISTISIDNLGVAVWFWISGGVLYGVSQPSLKKKSTARNTGGKTPRKVPSDDSNYFAPIVGFLVSIAVLIIMVPALRISAGFQELQRTGVGGTQAVASQHIDSVANIQPSNIQVKAALANLALQVGAIDEGLKLIASINRQDPRSVDGSYLGASAYEATKNYKAALPYRQRLLQLDRWSTRNMLQLVTDFVALKDMAKAREMSSRLSQLYPKSSDAQSAAALVKG